ncbi:hypothetical protein BS78_01G127300 [Paspalum vaginatum]|nr:hypothetical protein BS78_01G127300 [Paspalum vaginatum]
MQQGASEKHTRPTSSRKDRRGHPSPIISNSKRMCLKIACFGLHNEDDWATTPRGISSSPATTNGYGQQQWQHRHYGGHGLHDQQQHRPVYYGIGGQAGPRADGHYGGGGGFTTAVAQPTAAYYRYPAPDGALKRPATNNNDGRARYTEMGRY